MSNDFDTLIDHAVAEDSLRREGAGQWRCVIQYTDAGGEAREWTVADWDTIDHAAVLALAEVPREAVQQRNATVMSTVAAVVEAQLPMILRGIWHREDSQAGGAG